MLVKKMVANLYRKSQLGSLVYLELSLPLMLSISSFNYNGMFESVSCPYLNLHFLVTHTHTHTLLIYATTLK